MSAKTVKVSNVSLSASEQDIKEFFSFSGDIEYLEFKSVSDASQHAFVTFKDPQGANTAVLLSGATIVDKSVTVDLEPDYVLPPTAAASVSAAENKNAVDAGSEAHKAEDVVTSMLAKGFILGKDALNKARTFDEKHQFTSTATAKVASLDQKIGVSQTITIGATIVNDKVKEMDQKYQVSEKTKVAYVAAGQTVSSAGSAIMNNRYVLTGASWVAGAFGRVTKAAEEVGQKTMDRMVEEEHDRIVSEGYTHLDSPHSPKATAEETKPASPKP